MSATLTFAGAVAGEPLAKLIWIEDGQIVRVDPSPKAFLHHFAEATIDNLGDLRNTLEVAAEHNHIVVRGKPKAPIGRRAIYDDPKFGPAGLTVEPRKWTAFDWDDVPIAPYQPEPADPEIADDQAEAWNWARPDPLLDPEIGVLDSLRRLPPAFRGVSCAWQVTGSAGLKPGWRLRTWHLLDHPCTGAEIKVWLDPAIKRRLVDPCTLIENQAHYLSVTCVGGPDPCPRRFGILRQDGGEIVLVPDIAAIARRQKDQARLTRSPQATKSSRGRGQGGTVERRLQDCVDDVRSAPDGTKHPSYVREVARAKALCDRSGADWRYWREQLRAAYVASLPPGEAERRRSSVDGALDWVERRTG